MRKAFALTATLIVLTLFSVPLCAQQPRKPRPAAAKTAPSQPSVDQIINKYVQALGGEAAYRKLTSRTIKGTVTLSLRPNKAGTGTIECFEKAPNKSLAIINLPGVGPVHEGYNGSVAWSHEAQEGVRLMEGPELASAKADSDFYKDIRLTEVFPSLTFKGTQKIGTLNTYKVVGVTADGYTETMYFDSVSGLLVKIETVEVSPEGKLALAIQFGDYREVDGIKIPFAARHQSAEFTMVFRLTEVKHNVMIEDSKFEKPTAK